MFFSAVQQLICWVTTIHSYSLLSYIIMYKHESASGPCTQSNEAIYLRTLYTIYSVPPPIQCVKSEYPHQCHQG